MALLTSSHMLLMRAASPGATRVLVRAAGRILVALLACFHMLLMRAATLCAAGEVGARRGGYYTHRRDMTATDRDAHR